MGFKIKAEISGWLITCRYPSVSGDPGASFRPSAPQHHRIPLGSPEECFCFHPGTHPIPVSVPWRLWSLAEFIFQLFSILLSFQVNCISTEFTPRKHGGEKGVPFRIQVDTYTTNEHGEYVEHVHSSSCQVKVFKVQYFIYSYLMLISDF